MSARIEARGIVNRFGPQVVHDGLSLTVEGGEVMGIAGGSGTGKSVLLKTLVGLHAPQGGEVTLDGRPVEEIDGAERAKLLGVLFQQGALFSSLTVAENIALPLAMHTETPPEEREAIAREKLALTGLDPDVGAKYPADLSGGMVKRAAFARALALEPRILFLDEPTAGLDPIAASGLDELIGKLNGELGITFVVVTHDLETLFAACDRATMLVDGRAITGTIDELLEEDEPWIREYLHGPRARGALAARRESRHGS